MFVEHKEAGESQETKPLDEASKLLLKAAALIEDFGHAKNALLDNEGRYCIAGAINFAAFGDARSFAYDERKGLAFERMHAACGGSFIPWNNASSRTQEEVISTLRRAALTGK